jgi:predicted MFS family arabinose efflux permease
MNDRGGMAKSGRPLLLTAVLVAVLFGGLVGMSQLRFASFLSDSINGRLEVVARAAGQDLSAAIDLGLALDEVANGEAILERASHHDPRIAAIYVVDTEGTIIHATSSAPDTVDPETEEAFLLAVTGVGGTIWDTESDEFISSGILIEGSFGQPVGGVVVEYPTDELRIQTRQMTEELALLGALVAAGVIATIFAVFWATFRRLDRDGTTEAGRDIAVESDRPELVPVIVSGVLVVGVIAFGVLAVPAFNDALSPELERRASLIGETISDDTERAIGVGIPLTELVGVEEYFGAFLEEFPEINYLAVTANNDAILYSSDRVSAAGGRVGRAQSDTYSFDVSSELGQQGTVDVGVDPDFVESKLRELALDMVVILIVALVIMFEFSRAATRGLGSGRTVSAPVATANGDISSIRIVLFLFVVAEELNKSFLPLFIGSAENPIPRISSSVAISLPIAAYLLAVAVASPFAGRLTARFGRRGLFLAGVVPAALSHLGMIFADTVVQITVLRTMTGIGYALATIACLELILDRIPAGKRARGIGAFVTVVIGGTFVGTALGGIIADRRGYDTVFLISFALVVVAAILAFRMIPRDSDSIEGAPDFVTVKDMQRVLRKPDLVLLMAGVTIPMNVLMAAFLWYLVPLVLASIGSTTSATARTLMVYYLVILLGSPIAARAAGRVKNWALVGFGSVVSGVALLLPAWSTTSLTVFFAVFVVGVGHAAVRGPQIDLALSFAETEMPESGREPVLAAMRTLERLGSLVGLLVVAVLVAQFGLGAAMASIGLVSALAGSVYLGLRWSKSQELIDA